jgi:hypothetical protein
VKRGSRSRRSTRFHIERLGDGTLESSNTAELPEPTDLLSKAITLGRQHSIESGAIFPPQMHPDFLPILNSLRESLAF